MLVQPVTQRQIDNLLKQPPHAVGLIGAEGSGKGYLATMLAATVLAVNHEALEKHAHVFAVDASVDGSIEKVRELQKFLQLSVPGKQSLKRAVIIEHAESLGKEAQNALLKTLEEPPQDTIIICTVTNRQQLLATVWSRLQWITVRPVHIDAALEAFSPNHTAAEITRAYYMSEGNAGVLFALLNSDEEHPLKQSVLVAKKILASSRYERLKLVDELIKSKEHESTIDGLRRVLQAAVHASAKKSTPEDNGELKRLYQQLTLIIETGDMLRTKVQPKLALTRLFHSL